MRSREVLPSCTGAVAGRFGERCRPGDARSLGVGSGVKVGQGPEGLGGRMLTVSQWQEASQGWTSKDQAVDSVFVFGGVSFRPTFFVLFLPWF